MGCEPSDVRSDVDTFCAGANPPTNGLEERLDMIVAQLSVIAIELNRINNGRTYGPYREACVHRPESV